MKKIFFLCSIIMMITISNACKKDAESTPTSNNVTYPVSGTWRVSSFFKDNVDLTSSFTNCTITCANSGVMTIHENGHDYTCNWNYNGSSHEMCNLQIMGCDDNSILWEMEEDWDMTYPDNQHCSFSSHNPNHNCTMIWEKI